MTIMEALEQNRASATVFAGYGMGCIGCLAASLAKTIAEACRPPWHRRGRAGEQAQLKPANKVGFKRVF